TRSDGAAAPGGPGRRQRPAAGPPGPISGGADGWVGTVCARARGNAGVGEHADDVGLAVAPQPLDRVLPVRLHAHGVSVRPSGGAVVEAARRGRVVPATDATPHLDRVVGLVQPHAGDLADAIEQRPGGSERALAPSILQELVTAEQNDATRHRRLSIPLAD